MIVYHGTTRTCARKIFDEGFLPKPPSRRVWFAVSRTYAMGRAKTQARRTKDAPVILACDLDLAEIRREVGRGQVVQKRGTIAVDGPVPVHVLRAYPYADTPTIPQEVAGWMNSLLALKPPRTVKPDHPGLIRLSRWINYRFASEPERPPRSSELVEKARKWLPEYLVGFKLTPRRLRKHRRIGFVDYSVDGLPSQRDPREAEALDCLDDPRADQRVRGLTLLAEIRDPDLFDWCAMFLDDDTVTVRVAALQTMLKCADGALEVIEPLAESENRRVRAAAIAALAKHSGDDSPRWIERGLRDIEVCVRAEAVRFLRTLDRRRHRSIFDLARHDPNPDVAARARKLLLGR